MNITPSQPPSDEPATLPPSANTPNATEPPQTIRLPVGSQMRINGKMLKVTSGRERELVLLGDCFELSFLPDFKLNIFGVECRPTHIGRKILKLSCPPRHRFDTRALPAN